ncbi:MAG: hypothetical protein Fur006_07650 [Coleofasciculaceae cyanobacterium]
MTIQNYADRDEGFIRLTTDEVKNNLIDAIRRKAAVLRYRTSNAGRRENCLGAKGRGCSCHHPKKGV